MEGKNVYMVAATLRPETMYGQTNCWIHPTIKYVACLQTSGEVFISTRRSALNMAYQGFSKEDGKVDVLVELVGQVRNIVLYSITCPNTGMQNTNLLNYLIIYSIILVNGKHMNQYNKKIYLKISSSVGIRFRFSAIP